MITSLFPKITFFTGLLLLILTLIIAIAYGFTIGGVVSLCAGGVLVAIGIWFRKLSQAMQRVVLALSAIGLLFFLIVTTIVIGGGSTDTVTYDEHAVLVLGCGIKGEKPLPTLIGRLERCVEYLECNPGALVVVSGGQGANEDITESEAMKRFLVSKGIPETQILKETNSRNTVENLQFSKKVLGTYFESNSYTLACITSDYHVYRSRLTAKRFDLDVKTLGADVKWYLRPSAYCREVISVCKFWLER